MRSTECEKIIFGFPATDERLSVNDGPRRIVGDETMSIMSAVFGLPSHPENSLDSPFVLSHQSSDAEIAVENLQNLNLDRESGFRQRTEFSLSRSRLSIEEEYGETLAVAQTSVEMDRAVADPSDEEICLLLETAGRNDHGRRSDIGSATLCAAEPRTSRGTVGLTPLKSNNYGHGCYGSPLQPVHAFVSISHQKRWRGRRNKISTLKRPFLDFYKMQMKRQKEKIKAWISSRPNKLLNN